VIQNDDEKEINMRATYPICWFISRDKSMKKLKPHLFCSKYRTCNYTFMKLCGTY